MAPLSRAPASFCLQQAASQLASFLNLPKIGPKEVAVAMQVSFIEQISMIQYNTVQYGTVMYCESALLRGLCRVRVIERMNSILHGIDSMTLL